MRVGKLAVKLERDGTVDDAVAEELQPLVVRGREAAMRERASEQVAIAEDVSYRAAEAIQVHSGGRDRAPHGAEVGWKSKQKFTLP